MQHKITQSTMSSESGSSSGTTVSGTTFKIGTTAIAVDRTLGVGTDVAIPIAFTVANLQSLYMLSSKNATIEVNSGSSPTSTVSLKAGSPLIWQADDGYFANPLTGTTTVANFFVTNTESTRLQVLALAN